ncbi:MAG: TetR family transcriptional regulator [Verrucomicrobia bacterium]|nr:TetR family transcriptional regulator [Verrucomicrobiota bacterium]
MASPELPLTRDRIVAAAEDVLRRFGPEKATVVDVARALGVSHAAVYRHVKTKAELLDLVVQRWVDEMMPPLRALVARSGSAPKRLRQLFDTLIDVKRRRAAADPELFTAYRSLSAEAQSVAAAHLDELVRLGAAIIRSGIEEGAFRHVDPVAASQAILFATSRFHHPAHAREWADPKLDVVYDEIWRLLMEGLSGEKNSPGSKKKNSLSIIPDNPSK